MTTVAEQSESITISPLLDIPRPTEPKFGFGRHTTGWLPRLLFSRASWVVGIGVLALAARLAAIRTAYDIFIDEITYTNISLSVAHGHGVTLYGQPFALHPPAAFGLYALAILIFGLHGGTESVLFSLRNLDAVLGMGTCVVTFLFLDRIARRRVAIVASLLMAIDPLAISFDSRVMLEAPAQLAVVLTMLCLLMADLSGAGSLTRRHWLVAAGVGAAWVMTTKETFGLVVLCALVCLFLTGWVISRKESLVVAILAVAGYAISVVALGLSEGFSVWWNATFGGALRLVGVRQVTGFNSPQVHVTLLSRVLANGPTFAVTYILLGLGPFCAIGLLRRCSPWNSSYGTDSNRHSTVLVAVWTLSAALYLGYATVFGTIEEQMYYILLLPAVLSVCLWSSGFLEVQRRFIKVAAVIAICTALLVDGAVWFSVHTGRDDEYAALVSWEAVHVPPTAVVAATDGTSQFLLSRGIIGQWASVPQLKAHHVDFVILSTLLVQQGYGLARPGFESAVERGGRLVFEANGVSDGSLRIYDVRRLTAMSR